MTKVLIDKVSFEFAEGVTKVEFDEHAHDASDITSGTLDADRLPDIPDDKLPVVSVTKGGTGANTAAAARANLDVYSKNEAKMVQGDHRIHFSEMGEIAGGEIKSFTFVFPRRDGYTATVLQKIRFYMSTSGTRRNVSILTYDFRQGSDASTGKLLYFVDVWVQNFEENFTLEYDTAELRIQYVQHPFLYISTDTDA